MTGRKAVKERLLKEQKEAGRYARLLLQNQTVSQDEVTEAVFQYICSKFMLTAEESRGISLYSMSEKSIDRAVELHLPVAKEGETATTCGMAGSAAMKLALLYSALQKDFNVSIPVENIRFVKTVEELGAQVYKALS